VVVTPANRDSLREQAFALSAQGIGYREIATRLGINKDTAMKYVREERERRSHDRQAEDAIRDAVASLRHVLTDLHEQYGRIEGSSPHSMYARAKVAEAIRRCCRDLIGLYGVTLPETDPEIVSMKRTLEMTQAPFPTPGGYPPVGEQAILDRLGEEAEQQLAELGVIPQARPSPGGLLPPLP
jgi:transposase